MIQDLLNKNKSWAKQQIEADPSYFSQHASGQNPKVIWIGCSDSRVVAEQLLGMGPGEVFVHRNVANLIQDHDTSCQSVFQFAIGVLKVPNIVVCGHTGCGGCQAGISGDVDGPLAEWISPLNKLYTENKADIDQQPDLTAQANMLAEMNVKHQVEALKANPYVKAAWDQGQDLAVHGAMYDVGTGQLRDLEVTVTGA